MSFFTLTGDWDQYNECLCGHVQRTGLRVCGECGKDTSDALLVTGRSVYPLFGRSYFEKLKPASAS